MIDTIRLDSLRSLSRAVDTITTEGRTSLTYAGTLSKNKKVVRFSFRASGQGIDRYSVLVNQTGAVAGTTSTTGNSTNQAVGVIATTKTVLFFQKDGSDQIKQLGFLDGFQADEGFIFPKGAGTYLIKIVRAGQEAYRGDVDYTLSVRFVRSNLTTKDKPSGSPFFF